MVGKGPIKPVDPKLARPVKIGLGQKILSRIKLKKMEGPSLHPGEELSVLEERNRNGIKIETPSLNEALKELRGRRGYEAFNNLFEKQRKVFVNALKASNTATPQFIRGVFRGFEILARIEPDFPQLRLEELLGQLAEKAYPLKSEEIRLIFKLGDWALDPKVPEYCLNFTSILLGDWFDPEKPAPEIAEKLIAGSNFEHFLGGLHLLYRLYEKNIERIEKHARAERESQALLWKKRVAEAMQAAKLRNQRINALQLELVLNTNILAEVDLNVKLALVDFLIELERTLPAALDQISSKVPS